MVYDYIGITRGGKPGTQKYNDFASSMENRWFRDCSFSFVTRS